MSNFEILLSCMYENNFSILDRSNIQCSSVIINQCNVSSIVECNEKGCLWINSTDRGLSISRNMAIDKSEADVCLIADNDEVFDSDVEKKVLTAYELIKDADIIIFDVRNVNKKLRDSIFLFTRLQLLRVASVQITFKRESIIKNKLRFDEKLGAGTGNGAGEENKFLLDAYDKGLKIYHYPIYIATLEKSESTWFKGYDEDYFYKRGMTTRYILGLGISLLYAVHFLVFKYKRYKNNISIGNAGKSLLKGILHNKLSLSYDKKDYD